MTFAEKLKKARNDIGLSQIELAKKTGIGVRTIGSYEQGTRFPRRQEALTKLAAALKVDMNYLISDEDSFVAKAGSQYGTRGARQAKEVVEDVKLLLAGGELAEEDMDEMMRAIQDAYWIAKEKNREKFSPKKYR